MHGHAQWAEVAPLAPLLVLLGEWCAFMFVIGCIFVVSYFVTAIAGTLAGFSVRLPFIGDPVAAVIHKAEHAITDKLGEAESYFDAKAGGALHEMARLIDWTYREIKSHANLLWTLATVAVGPAAVGAIRMGIAALHGNVHAVTQRVTDTYARVLRLEHRLAHTITAGVLPRLGRLEREYDHIIDKDIAGLRSRTKTVEKSLENVWEYVRSHPWTVVTDAFVGAVAVALGRLGLGWVRCPTAQTFFNKRGCTAWNDLEGLLAAAVGIAASLSLVELAKAEQEIVGDLATVVSDFWQV